MKQSLMDRTWMCMMMFFIFSFSDLRMGVMGIMCMIMPLFLSLKGEGKIWCSHYCPRGSFLWKFLKPVSKNKALPEWITGKKNKNIIMIGLFAVFSIFLFLTDGSAVQIGAVVLLYIVISTITAVIMGYLFKPRSWCQVCPMGNLTRVIRNIAK